MKPRPTLLVPSPSPDGEGAGRRVGRKTAYVVYQTTVETPHFVRRDVNRARVKVINGWVGAQIQDVLALFRHLHKILMTVLDLKKKSPGSAPRAFLNG
jgi:hypothetical protein